MLMAQNRSIDQRASQHKRRNDCSGTTAWERMPGNESQSLRVDRQGDGGTAWWAAH